MSIEQEVGKLLIRMHDAERAREALEVRVGVLEHFLKEKFPGDMAGEAETVADPSLHPVHIIYGTPKGTPEQRG